MNKLKHSVTVAAVLLVPFVASAQFGTGLNTYLRDILNFINAFVIPFILGVAFLFFVWGMFQFFIAGGANEEAKEKGKSLLIYAILGFVVIIVFWGIINLLVGATGLNNAAPPTIPGGIQLP